jgi:hypothetical protein
VIADDRNFYKVEKWTKDGAKVDCSAHQADHQAEDAGIRAVAEAGGERVLGV